MRAFKSRVTIDASRERVFEYLSDIANHAAFSDHYLKDCRLERLESRGVGAAARFRIAFGRSLWAEIVIEQLDPPHRVALEGQTGRAGRVPVRAVYTLTPYGHDMTEVEYEVSTAPASRVDDLRAVLGGRAWLKVQTRRALRRLAQAMEQPGEAAARASRVASG